MVEKTDNLSLNEKEIFTDKEAAVFLRCSTISLWRARKKGLITFRRAMGKILYTKEDLLDFLERCKRGGFNSATEEVK
jgi:hypothetical protein